MGEAARAAARQDDADRLPCESPRKALRLLVRPPRPAHAWIARALDGSHPPLRHRRAYRRRASRRRSRSGRYSDRGGRLIRRRPAGSRSAWRRQNLVQRVSARPGCRSASAPARRRARARSRVGAVGALVPLRIVLEQGDRPECPRGRRPAPPKTRAPLRGSSDVTAIVAGQRIVRRVAARGCTRNWRPSSRSSASENLRLVRQQLGELRAGHLQQLAVAPCPHRGGSRLPREQRQLSHDRSRRQDAGHLGGGSSITTSSRPVLTT